MSVPYAVRGALLGVVVAARPFAHCLLAPPSVIPCGACEGCRLVVALDRLDRLDSESAAAVTINVQAQPQHGPSFAAGLARGYEEGLARGR